MATSFLSSVVSAGQDATAAQYNNLRKDVLQNGGDYATSAGTANAYTLAIDAAITAYVAGQVFKFKANFTNTDAATLNVNTIGAIDIKKNGSEALVAGDIQSGEIIICVYDGTNMQMINDAPQSAIIESVAAGMDLIAQKAVGIESDGEAYVPRFTASTLDVGFTTDDEVLASTTTRSRINKIAACGPYLDASNGQQKVNIVATMYRSPNNFDYVEGTYNITTRAFETLTTSDFQGGAPISAGDTNPVELTYQKCVLISQENVTGASRIYARVLHSLDSTPALGTSLQVITAASGITDALGVGYSSTVCLLLYIESGALKVRTLTESSNTLTAGSPTTLIASGVTSIEDVQRFGTTAFYIVGFNDGSGEGVICFEFDGSSTFTAGSSDTIPAGSSNTQFSLDCLSDTKAIVAYANGTSVRACVVDRSARELTVQTESSTLFSTTDSEMPLKLIAWDENTAEIQIQNQTSTGIKAILARIDDSTITAVGSALTVTSNSIRTTTVSVVKATPTIGVRFYQDNSDDWHMISYRYQHTLDQIIGVINTAYAEAATAIIGIAGSISSLAGLTPGERYYAGIGGTLVTRTEGGEHEIGRAISATKLKIGVI